MRTVFIFVCALAMAAGTAWAQDCNPCDSKAECGKAVAKSDAKPAAEPMTLIARIEKLETGAKKGCAKSEAKLAELVKMSGAKDVAAMKQRVSAYEKYAPMGCPTSQETLAKLDAVFQPKPTLSTQVAALCERAGRGCGKSKAVVTAMMKAAGTSSPETLMADLETLEAHAGKGCDASARKLATIATMMPAERPPLSLRVAKLAKGCEAGCEKSKAKLAALTSECGDGCAKTLVETLSELEACAADGCEMSAAKLAMLEAKLEPKTAPMTPVNAAPAKAEAPKKTDCGDCTDCSDCADCPGK